MTSIDGGGAVVVGVEGIRAFLPVWCSIHYLPLERFEVFYWHTGRWEEEQPE